MLTYNQIENFFPKNVSAIYTTKSLNFKSNFSLKKNLNDDEKKIVLANRKLIERNLKVKIKWLNQVHKNETVDLDNSENVNADSSFCSKNKIASTVFVADCLPILVSSANGVIIGSIHAGWRGLCSNIIGNFLTKFNKKINYLKNNLDTRGEKNNKNFYPLHFWFGPCISKKNYEVGNDVKKKFDELGNNYSNFFHKIDNNKWLCDIKMIAVEMVKNQLFSREKFTFFIDDRCTYDDSSLFYSYRKKMDSERIAVLIWKKF